MDEEYTLTISTLLGEFLLSMYDAGYELREVEQDTIDIFMSDLDETASS